MRYIKNPNLPDEKVNTVLISPDCPDNILQELAKNQINCIKTARNRALKDVTSGHPDMSVLHLGENQFVCDKNAYPYYKAKLTGAQINILEEKMQPRYPKDAALNIGILGKFAFFNPKSINEQIFEMLNDANFTSILVNQGYTKCNIVTVAHNAIITEDISIYNAAKQSGIDTLLIQSGNITLPGYRHGFIGGACGKLNRDILAITGNLDFIPEHNLIKSFCKSHGVDIIELSNKRPCDIGSILPIV